jgi:hypothetical protein
VGELSFGISTVLVQQSSPFVTERDHLPKAITMRPLDVGPRDPAPKTYFLKV